MKKHCDTCHQMRPLTHFYPSSGKPRCKAHLKWTLARRFKVMEMIEKGKSSADIAKAFSTTEASITLMRKRYKLDTTKDSRMTARQVAELMGVGCAKTVTRWIAEGFLKGKHGYKQGPHRVWLVKHEDLLAFIADERTWHVWQQERISDPYLRRYADRERKGVRFMRPGEVAWEFFVEHTTVNQWIHKGWIPARKWGNWWIDERDVEAFRQERGAA